MKRKDRKAEKAAADPQAVQRGRLRAAALSVWVSVLFLFAFSWRVLGCGARARSAKVCGAATAAPQCLKAALVYASTRHGAIFVFPSISSLKIPLFDDIRVSTIRSRIGFIKCCQGRQVDGGSKNKSMSSSKVCYSINYSLINVRNHS